MHSMRYYIDTRIFRDYFEGRNEKRPLGEFALQFLNGLKETDTVYYSRAVVEELISKSLNPQKIMNIVQEKGILKEAKITPQNINEAIFLARQRGIPKGDAMHAILARENDAIVVTR